MEMDATNRETQAEKPSQYEQLTGETGRRIRYRAERFPSARLFNGTTPEFLIGGEAVSLENLSFSGLAVVTPRKYAVGDKLPVQIIHRGLVLHEAVVEVRRNYTENSKQLMAVQITDHPIVVSQLIDSYHKQRLRARLETNIDIANRPVPLEYKAFCADVVYLIRSYRTAIEGFNIRLGTPEAEEALNYFEEKLAPLWREVEIKGAGLTYGIYEDPEVQRAYKEFTERTVTPEILNGPIFHRSYFKPRGFPGDSEIMAYVYDKERLGAAPFDQVCHYLGIQSAFCLGTRMEWMCDLLQTEIKAGKRNGDQQPFGITNLGAGAAREISLLLKAISCNEDINITLIDQDELALKSAYQTSFLALAEKSKHIQIDCMHVSFKELMMAGRLFKKIPPQQVIYSIGLMDYFKIPMAKLFARSVYSQLAPGGLMVLANMREFPGTIRWVLEYVTDWSLIFRSREDMEEIAADLGTAEVEVKLDSTGQVYFLCARKPLA